MNTEAKLADLFAKTLGRIKFVEFCETVVLRPWKRARIKEEFERL